jgi:hypothetical protein
MVDERLDFLLESRERISGDIGEVVGELRDLSSAFDILPGRERRGLGGSKQSR